MPTPFFQLLKKVHTLPKVTSYDADHSAYAKELQTLIDAGDSTGYQKRLSDFKQQGLNFRLTDMKVYETRDEHETIDVSVACQVKGHSITWYFWAPGGKDQYPQEFRDKLYTAAGECHTKVKNGCDLYYRGSNAFHVKTMHHLETEADHNHNHYRMKNNQPVTPVDLAEHLQAFKEHEVHDLFFEEGEVDHICHQFNKFHEKWTKKVDDKLSQEEKYRLQPSQRLNEADIIEFNMFGIQQEPCRISVDELTLDYNAARKAIETTLATGTEIEVQAATSKLLDEFNAIMSYRLMGGSRGIGSERAMTRQIEGSSMPTIPLVTTKDDDLGVKIPPIPEWAMSAKKAVKEAISQVNKDASEGVVAASSHTFRNRYQNIISKGDEAEEDSNKPGVS